MLECLVCHHPQRYDIDSALVGKRPRLHFIVDRFGLTETSLIRHRNACLAKDLFQAKAPSEVQSASVLVREIKRMAQFTGKLLSLAVKERDFKLAARVIEQLEVQLAVKAWDLEEANESRNRAGEQAGKLRVLSGRSSVRDWVRGQTRL